MPDDKKLIKSEQRDNAYFNHYYWTPTVSNRDSSRFVLESELPNFGFKSLYAVTEEVSASLQKTGIKGYQGPVWSPTLKIDCDKGESGRKRAQGILNELGLAYSVFESGNKGFHFYIKRKAQPSTDLPELDKEFVKDLSLDLFDLSIYTHLHLFRVTGGRHEVTGRKKRRLYEVKGNGQELNYDGSPDYHKREPLPQTWLTEQSIFDDRYVNSLITPAIEGDRHRHFVKLCFALRDRGVPMEAAIWLIEEVNKLAEIPKENWEVEKLVNSIYR